MLLQGRHRNLLIAASVLLFHVAALWALQSGLLRRVVDAVEVVVPVQLVSAPVPQASPPPAPPPKPLPTPAVPAPAAVTPRPAAPVLPAAPQPVAVADDTPSPTAPTGVVAAQSPAPPIAAPVAAVPAPVAPEPKVELPSSDADYLHNPKPAFPPLSKRLGEQGRVLVRVRIGVDGLPQKADIVASSGFDRLDRTAVATALRWRYVPGKRGGVAEAMWFVVPIDFVLE